jgi:alkylhydroperoxidase family enzyme
VQAALDDWRSAPVNPQVRATLGFLEKLTLKPESVTAADIRPLRAEGLSDSAIEDAIHVCTLFNIYDRLADSFGFDIPDARGFDISATMLLKRGYVF